MEAIPHNSAKVGGTIPEKFQFFIEVNQIPSQVQQTLTSKFRA